MKERIKNIISKVKNFWSKKWFRIAVIILVLIIVFRIVGGIFFKKQNSDGERIRTAPVTVRDISNTLEATGTISPLDQYDVTSLVTGEVVKCTFSEGDKVKKGEVLYKISTEDIEQNIKSAKTSMERAKDNYQDALEEMDEVNVKAKSSGYITKLYVEVGDEIQNGAKIADIYDNTYMDIDVQFSSADVKNSWIGRTATVTMETTGDIMTGTVTAVSQATTVLSGNRVVSPVTIRVKNPGGLTAGDTATAKVAGIMCSAAGTFEAKEQKELMAKRGGEVLAIHSKEGSYVNKNQLVLTLDSEEVENQVQSAKEQYDDAKDQYENQLERLEDYTITAPISGEIITKNTKKGDKLSAGNNGATVMATIYDLSAVTFDMNIDELDVLNLQEKMEVNITADALEGQTFSGYVDNISLESTASGGITQYPVTVKIEEVGDLLPGMNVTGEIVFESVSNVLAIPSAALQRGNKVYVKDSDGDKISNPETTKEQHRMPPMGENGEFRERRQRSSRGEGAEITGTIDSETGIPEGFHAVTVEVGLDDGDYIEIISGLSEGDIVYIPVTETTGANMMMFGMGRNTQRGMNMGGMSGGNRGGMLGGNRSGMSGGMPGR